MAFTRLQTYLASSRYGSFGYRLSSRDRTQNVSGSEFRLRLMADRGKDLLY
jgi:hypothetical protein